MTLRPYAIETSIFNTLTLEEIYTILDTYLNQLQIPYNTLDITMNTYALSKARPGSYEIYYELHSEDLTHQGILYIDVSHPLEDPTVLYGLIGAAGLLSIGIFFLTRKHLKKKR